MPRRAAFTLVELLSVIAIVAVLATAAVYFTASYVQWSKNVADQRTLLVLNDAITRYKTEGGGTSSFTVGAPIGNVIARLQSVITYGGQGHQVMQAGVTYPARSISAMGTGAQYQFYRYNTSASQTPSASTPTSDYPHGQLVGTMGNGGGPYNGISITSSSGYWSCQPSGGGAVQTYSSGSHNLSAANSYSFWASDASGNPSGNISTVNCNNNYLTSLDVSKLTSITSLDCSYNSLTSINVTPLTSLSFMNCMYNQITSLNVSGLTNLSTLVCFYNKLGPIYLGGHTPGTFPYTPQTGTTPSLQ